MEELALDGNTESSLTIMGRKAERVDMDTDRWRDMEGMSKEILYSFL